MKKNIINGFVLRWYRIVAFCAYIAAYISANSACSCLYYEPEQPKELVRLKKNI